MEFSKEMFLFEFYSTFSKDDIFPSRRIFVFSYLIDDITNQSFVTNGNLYNYKGIQKLVDDDYYLIFIINYGF